MTLDYIPLLYTPGRAWAALREVCGADEESLSGSGTRATIELLDRLLSPVVDGEGGVAGLVAADRDRLLAAVYERLYGPRVQSTLVCRNCRERFDLDFSLSELIASLADEGPAEGVETCGDGTYRLADGRRFRLPTGADELAVSRLPAAEAEAALLKRCLIEGETQLAGESQAAGEPQVAGVPRTAGKTPFAGEVQAAGHARMAGERRAVGEAQAPVLDLQETMRRAAPLVAVDLEARCPECEEIQPVHFDLQSYLLGRLLSERMHLAGEVHWLAVTYRWGPAEILALPRSRRQAYVALIQAEADRLAEHRL